MHNQWLGVGEGVRHHILQIRSGLGFHRAPLTPPRPCLQARPLWT